MTAAESAYLSDIIKKEQGRLFGFIRQQVTDEMDARDIMQDVFYQLTVGFNDIRSAERITSWLFTVAKNKIIDHFRKKKSTPFSFIEIPNNREQDDQPLMLEDILPSLTRDPEDEYMRNVIWSIIEKSLTEMPEEQSEVFILNEFEDMTFNEISEQLGVGINTLLSRKRYAVLCLREKLKELYNQLKT
ncbi:MAG: RNA polymerase subunit sigma-24 [Bacteroides sp. SM23_62_1]|nr:MAG: RNA polymerase subunit sigma-24 [Bacteroides sp. SM23_62_1]